MYSLQQLLIGVRSSLWFLPALLVAASIAAAFALIQVDRGPAADWSRRWPRLFGVGAEGARGMLSAIATSMVTVAGVTFSITVVALTQASSQYSPLILRNFMRDRANQVVLGVFGGIIVYSLVVLRSIRGGDDGFVPRIAVLAALLYAVSGIGFLLFFIHHIATVLQASSILAIIARDTLRAVDDLFPEEIGAGAEELDGPEPGAARGLEGLPWHRILPRQTGYIQAVRSERLLELACACGGVVRMERGIGEFAVADVPIAAVALDGVLGEEARSDLQACFIIGEYRTIEQDAAFGIRQIVDMAVKALSPGINDPTTACSCLDYLSAILVRLAPRRLTTRERFSEGRLRVLAIGPTFESLVALSFDQIRQNAAADTTVLATLIGAIELTARHALEPRRREVLRGQLALLGEHAGRVIEDRGDRAAVMQRLAQAGRALADGPERTR